MKNLFVFAVLMTALVLIGCGSSQIREGSVLANRFAIETANSPVNSFTQGQTVPANTVKDIKGGALDPKDSTYCELHAKKDDGSFELVAAGLIKDGKLMLIKVYKVVTEQVVLLYLFKEGVDVWSQRITIKVTTVIPTTQAPATPPTTTVTPAPTATTPTPTATTPAPTATTPTPTATTPAPAPAANPVITITEATVAAGRELTTVANLPTGATYQWFEDDGGTWKAITGATSNKYVTAPGVAPLRFKVVVTINASNHEAEVVVSP